MKTFRCCVVVLLSAFVALTCFAQSVSGPEAANSSVSTSRAVSSAPAVASNPAGASDRGFTFSSNFSGNHDSSSGWSSVIDSSVRYDFSKIFGVELGMPYYLAHNGYSSTVVTRLSTNPPLVTTYNALGDMYLKLHFAAPETSFGYSATITGTAPTGDTSSGISTGRPTFDLNNHFEHSFAFLAPFAELGIGDSSALINHRVRRPYTTLGPVSHYKAGEDWQTGADHQWQNAPLRAGDSRYRTGHPRGQWPQQYTHHQCRVSHSFNG